MTNRLPEFSQFVEYIVEGEHGEPVVLPLPLDQQALDNLYTLEALAEGYAHVAALGRSPKAVEANELQTMQAKAVEFYHEDIITNEIKGSDPVEIVTNLLEVRSYPELYLGAVIKEAGEVWFFEKNLYKAIQPHTVHDPAWLPGRTGSSALWKRFYEPEEGPQPWVQPLGAGYGYLKGAKVTHKGFIWQSDFEGENVWEPGVFGWSQLGPA